MYVNTVSDPVQNLRSEFVRCTLGNTFSSRKATVEITRDKSFWIPKGKHRSVSKGMTMKNRVQKFPRDMKVIFCHPLSHLKRGVIKLGPSYQRSGNGLWIQIRSNFPFREGKGNFKTLDRGLRKKKEVKCKGGDGLRDDSFEPQ